MTVAELIAKLQTFSPNARVYAQTLDEDFCHEVTEAADDISSKKNVLLGLGDEIDDDDQPFGEDESLRPKGGRS